MWPFGKSPKDRLLDAFKEQAVTADLGLQVEVKSKTAFVSGTVPNDRYLNLLRVMASGINGIEQVDLSGVTAQEVAAADAGADSGKDGASKAGAISGFMGEAGSADDPSAKAKAVLAALKAEASLADNPIDVLQKGTTVVLRGAVDSQEEHAKATDLALGVEGVTQVDTAGLQVIAAASTLNVTDDDGDVVYTVKSGDTLSHIALRYYGSAGRGSYMKIAEANGISDPNKIRVGQNLKIPGTTQGPEASLS